MTKKQQIEIDLINDMIKEIKESGGEMYSQDVLLSWMELWKRIILKP